MITFHFIIDGETNIGKMYYAVTGYYYFIFFQLLCGHHSFVISLANIIH